MPGPSNGTAVPPGTIRIPLVVVVMQDSVGNVHVHGPDPKVSKHMLATALKIYEAQESKIIVPNLVPPADAGKPS